MEQPLNAREFIQRFHLPQLVRISPTNEMDFCASDCSAPKRQENNEPSSLCDITDSQHDEGEKHSSSNRLLSLQATAACSTSETDTKLGLRLVPISKRPTLSRLQLEQPFLLYKAYKKLEICAYANDSKNELNERSGDPVYFPHNYKGWFSLHPDPNKKSFHLSTIEQVCLSIGGQVILTRDQLIAYQLPNKLSELTKLNNNQLLALPLAINLSVNNDSHLQQQHHSNMDRTLASSQLTSKRASPSSSKGPISELKQVTIGCGQVLRLCGIYEDVLPLIGQQQQQVASVYGSRQANERVRAVNSKQQRVVAPTGNGQCEPAQIAYNAPYTAKKSQAKLPTGKRYARCIVLGENSVDLLTGCAASGEQPLDEQVAADNNPAMAMTGRRKQADKVDNSSLNRADEYEVLIPLEQVGRFYLCATNQTIADELHCQGCSGSARNIKQLVFRLSQIIYLINMTRRLARWQPHQMAQQQQQQTTANSNKTAQHCSVLWRPLAAFDLPMQVRLVIGPRPENFSPTMLGASTTMESYFADEANVGGHLIGCKFHRSNSLAAGNCHNQVDEKSCAGGNPVTLSVDPICACVMQFVDSSYLSCRQQSNHQQQQQQQVKNHKSNARSINRLANDANRLACETDPNYSYFSGSFRLESLSKRDVLLACTIKQDPLVHLADYLVGQSSQVSREKPAKHTQHHATVAHRISWRRLQSHELAVQEDARQLTGITCDDQDEPKLNEKQSATKAGSKSSSSFSRLRACRSLISLSNAARRKKQRPNIPDSMLPAGVNLSKRIGLDQCSNEQLPQQGQENMRASSFNLMPPGVAGKCNSPVYHQTDLLVMESYRRSNDSIVLVEFDCNDRRVRFVRTFVESSMPTASIPDLVLSRIRYCVRNSYEWERQLKLSYWTLSRDFDICRRQMAARSCALHHPNYINGRRRLLGDERDGDRFDSMEQQAGAALTCRLPAGSSDSSDHSLAGAGRRTAPTLKGSHSSSELSNRLPAAVQVRNNEDQMRVGCAERSERSATAADCITPVQVNDSAAISSSSTASSSRSSSGVSSAAAAAAVNNKSSLVSPASLSTSSSSSSTSASSPGSNVEPGERREDRAPAAMLLPVRPRIAANSDGTIQANSSSKQVPAARSSRLLKLVHKILPSGRCLRPTTAVGVAVDTCAGEEGEGEEEGEEKEAERVARGRLGNKRLQRDAGRRTLALEAAASLAFKSAPGEQPHPTDAQRVRRRTRAAGERHLAAEHGPDSDQVRRSASNNSILTDDDRDELLTCSSDQYDSSGSHLYESLERLNEKRAAAAKLAGGGGGSCAQVVRSHRRQLVVADATSERWRQLAQVGEGDRSRLVRSAKSASRWTGAAHKQRQVRADRPSNTSDTSAVTATGTLDFAFAWQPHQQRQRQRPQQQQQQQRRHFRRQSADTCDYDAHDEPLQVDEDLDDFGFGDSELELDVNDDGDNDDSDGGDLQETDDLRRVRMEPVSIEACDGGRVNGGDCGNAAAAESGAIGAVCGTDLSPSSDPNANSNSSSNADADANSDADANQRRSGAESGAARAAEFGSESRVYANLELIRAAAQTHRQTQSHDNRVPCALRPTTTTASRMERKLAKLRRSRSQSRRDCNNCDEHCGGGDYSITNQSGPDSSDERRRPRQHRSDSEHLLLPAVGHATGSGRSWRRSERRRQRTTPRLEYVAAAGGSGAGEDRCAHGRCSSLAPEVGRSRRAPAADIDEQAKADGGARGAQVHEAARVSPQSASESSCGSLSSATSSSSSWQLSSSSATCCTGTSGSGRGAGAGNERRAFPWLGSAAASERSAASGAH